MLWSLPPFYALLPLYDFRRTTTIYPTIKTRMGPHAFGWCNCPHCPQSLQNQQRWSPSYGYISMPSYQPSHRHHICEWCIVWNDYSPDYVSLVPPATSERDIEYRKARPPALHPIHERHGRHTFILHGLPLRAVPSRRRHPGCRGYD